MAYDIQTAGSFSYKMFDWSLTNNTFSQPLFHLLLSCCRHFCTAPAHNSLAGFIIIFCGITSMAMSSKTISALWTLFLAFLTKAFPTVSGRNSEAQTRFFLPLALFPIANCDNMRIFCTWHEPEIVYDLGAHLSIPFYCSGPPFLLSYSLPEPCGGGLFPFCFFLQLCVKQKQGVFFTPNFPGCITSM